MSFFIKKVLFPTALFFSIFMLTLSTIDKPVTKNDAYILKSYKNTVALYNGKDIIKIYSNIVLNTLPKEDIKYFNKGIAVSTQTQAELFLEDFDG